MGPVLLYNIECTGSEARLVDCNAMEAEDDRNCRRIGVGCHNECE